MPMRAPFPFFGRNHFVSAESLCALADDSAPVVAKRVLPGASKESFTAQNLSLPLSLSLSLHLSPYRIFDSRSGLVRTCQEAEEQCNVAKAERLAALGDRDQLRAAFARAQEDKEAALQRAAEREREAEMMRMDKEFLARQSADLAAKCERAEEKVERKALKLKDAQRAKEQMEAQLLQVQALGAATHEDRVQAELAALRQRADQEIADIKKSTAELYQRQNQMLVDSKEEAVAELERLRTRLYEVEKGRDIAMREHAELTSSVESKISEARTVAKVKTMELERLHVSYDDAQMLNRQLRLEADMHKEKLDVIRTELAALQASSATRIAELEANLANASSRLNTFESIESNLSLAISDVGGFGPAGNLEIEKHVMALGSGAPTDPTQRMAQTMALARKVISQQKEIEALKKSLEEHDAEIQRLQRALADANKLLDSTSQPHELLVSAVRGRDEELRSARAEIERLKTVLAAVQGERNKLREQCAQLKADIEQVVEKRNTTETLQSAVTQLQAQQQINIMRLNQARLKQGGSSTFASRGGTLHFAELQHLATGPVDVSSGTVTLDGTNPSGVFSSSDAGGGGGGKQVGVRAQPQALWYQKLKARAAT